MINSYQILTSPLPGTPYGERLLKAAEKGCTALVKEILSEEEDIINYKDSDGYTPLHRACYQGWEDIVEVLLEHGMLHSIEGTPASSL